MQLLGQTGTIISASRRTDIPSFFSEWLIHRLRRGFVVVKNPFNPRQQKRVSLLPGDVSAIVFWTRDFSPMIKHLDFLEDSGYRYVVLWTITGYPKFLEPHNVPLKCAVESLRALSSRIGPQRIAWRYDPIIITDELTPRWHIENFRKIAHLVAGDISRIIISFMTPYRSVLKRLDREGISFDKNPMGREDVGEMLRQFVEICDFYGVGIQACCQGGALSPFGIDDGACIDAGWINDALGLKLAAPKDKGQRPNCLCAKSIDIGTYNTCPRGCLYCYAVKSSRRLKPIE